MTELERAHLGEQRRRAIGDHQRREQRRRLPRRLRLRDRAAEQREELLARRFGLDGELPYGCDLVS